MAGGSETLSWNYTVEIRQSPELPFVDSAVPTYFSRFAGNLLFRDVIQPIAVSLLLDDVKPTIDIHLPLNVLHDPTLRFHDTASVPMYPHFSPPSHTDRCTKKKTNKLVKRFQPLVYIPLCMIRRGSNVRKLLRDRRA